MTVFTVALAVVGCVVAIAAAWYAYGPHRAQRDLRERSAFVEVRRYLGRDRPRLTAQALDGYSRWRMPEFPGMLTHRTWLADPPFPLEQLRLEIDGTEGSGSNSAKILSLARKFVPHGDSGRMVSSYSDALELLAKPSLFENRLCYRLLAADLQSTSQPVVKVGLGRYFDSVDETEALAHQTALFDMLGKSNPQKLRELFGGPADVHQRCGIFSVSALTFRVENESASFLLHSRKNSNVAIAGNLVHIAPSGVFQPSSDDESTIERDLSFWLTLLREYAEEYLGVDEAQGEAGVALSYDHDEPYASINAAYMNGLITIKVLGMGLDPLTLCPELVVCAICSAETYDDVFSGIVSANSEGSFRGSALRAGKVIGYPFDERTVKSLASSTNASPAVRAGLTRAWEKRDFLFPGRSVGGL